MYTNHPDNNPLVQFLLFIVGLPYLIPFSGWFYFGFVLFNVNKLSSWVIVPLAFWSFICSRAAAETKINIQNQIAEQQGVVTTNDQWAMILLSVLQYPTFLAAMYVLFN